VSEEQHFLEQSDLRSYPDVKELSHFHPNHLSFPNAPTSPGGAGTVSEARIAQAVGDGVMGSIVDLRGS
jgi:hypothetical protein